MGVFHSKPLDYQEMQKLRYLFIFKLWGKGQEKSIDDLIHCVFTKVLDTISLSNLENYGP